MKSSNDILNEVKKIITTNWQTRKGIKVPESDDVRLGNDAVMLDGVVLYADITDSTELVDNYIDKFAAEVYKSYLVAACHIIRNNNGSITAFDGDRVMAVYLGSTKNSFAVKTALQINYIVKEINKVIISKYDTSFQLKQVIGIDKSKLFVAKTGIRNSNDLVWVGRSANYAAKLCSLVDGQFKTFITENVYNVLSKNSKYGGNPRKNMWTKRYWHEREMTIYKSDWYWEF